MIIKERKYIKIVSILLIFIFIFPYIVNYINCDFSIYFIDVGQGDSCIIRTKNKNIIIDGGDRSNTYDYGEKVVLPYLLDRNIKEIDYLIVSHFDSDHVGGLFSIIDNLKVKKILIGIQYSEYDNLKVLQEKIKGKNIEILILKGGDKVKIDKDVYLDILFPIEENYISENEINNNSLVFKLYYNNFSILFTGDIEKEAEEILVNKYGLYLKCDILKVAHHGSNTSSIKEFIENANPKYTLIGVGKNNNFGHPSFEVLDRLNNSKIYRTDLHGEITIRINKAGKIKSKVFTK